MDVEIRPGRLYKSRKSRPCDACRRRKVTCIMPSGPPCQRCVHFCKDCTFEQAPTKRKRPVRSTQHTLEERPIFEQGLVELFPKNCY